MPPKMNQIYKGADIFSQILALKRQYVCKCPRRCRHFKFWERTDISNPVWPGGRKKLGGGEERGERKREERKGGEKEREKGEEREKRRERLSTQKTPQWYNIVYMILLTTIWPFWYSLLTYLLIALCLSTDVRYCHVFVILYVWYLPYAYIHFYSPQYHSSYSSQSVYCMFCVRLPCYMPWYESKRKRIPKRYLLEYPILSWDIYDFHVDSMHLIHTS